MSVNTKIDWADVSWNPITGCTPVSRGCEHGYCRRHTKRLQNSPKTDKYRAGFDVVVCHPASLGEPARLRHPSRVFVCSMSDLFHDYVPIEFIKEVFAVMNRETRHQFQVLTKRSKRMAVLAPELTWTPNIWAGVTVEAPEYLPRIDDLRQVPATIRWISAEPLLEALPSVNLTGIHWLVVGGESGPGFRPMNPNWARDLRDQCQRAQVPFFFKQYAHNRRGVKRGAEIDGVMHHAYPV